MLLLLKHHITNITFNVTGGGGWGGGGGGKGSRNKISLYHRNFEIESNAFYGIKIIFFVPWISTLNTIFSEIIHGVSPFTQGKQIL